jgi:hypothetical protein
MSGLLAVRIFVSAVFLMVVVLDGRLFWSIVEPFAKGLEGYVGFLVFVCFAIWVTIRNGATLIQKFAHELMLDVALTSLAFRSIAGAVRPVAQAAGASGRCEISQFLYFLRSGSSEMWIQFFIVLGVARMLIWASSTMVHDVNREKLPLRGFGQERDARRSHLDCVRTRNWPPDDF